MNNEGKFKMGFLLGSVSGAIAGVVATLFLSPNSGEQNRDLVISGAKSLGEKGRNLVIKTRDAAGNEIQKVVHLSASDEVEVVDTQDEVTTTTKPKTTRKKKEE